VPKYACSALVSWPLLAIKPAEVNRAPRSDVNTKRDLGSSSRWGRRSARQLVADDRMGACGALFNPADVERGCPGSQPDPIAAPPMIGTTTKGGPIKTNLCLRNARFLGCLDLCTPTAIVAEPPRNHSSRQGDLLARPHLGDMRRNLPRLIAGQL
jgi:hypothetical protein